MSHASAGSHGFAGTLEDRRGHVCAAQRPNERRQRSSADGRERRVRHFPSSERCRRGFLSVEADECCGSKIVREARSAGLIGAGQLAGVVVGIDDVDQGRGPVAGCVGGADRAAKRKPQPPPGAPHQALSSNGGRIAHMSEAIATEIAAGRKY